MPWSSCRISTRIVGIRIDGDMQDKLERKKAQTEAKELESDDEWAKCTEQELFCNL